MIHVSFSSGLLLAAFDGALLAGVVTLAALWGRTSRNMKPVVIFYVVQAFLFLLAGLIYLFQGWRLDPLLIWATIFVHSAIFANLVKDFILFSLVRDR